MQRSYKIYARYKGTGRVACIPRGRQYQTGFVGKKGALPFVYVLALNYYLNNLIWMTRTAIIIGAGPAGLTAAWELLTRTDIKPIILEKTGDTGGISKTVNYKGNRIDIGGHRFFSKSDRVMNWWLSFMPLE